VRALEDAVVVLMVEKRQCVEDLDAILSVPGIDMVQFGPADYSMSIGRPGEFSHPEVLKAEETMIETALSKGIHPRAEISEPAEAARYLKLGVKHFCMGWDVGILHDYWRGRGEAMAGLLKGARGKKGGGKKSGDKANGKKKGNYR
jgi:4-hydroxy-2-oxoheptanedioate aldolase